MSWNDETRVKVLQMHRDDRPGIVAKSIRRPDADGPGNRLGRPTDTSRRVPFEHQPIVGITNSAPVRMPVGQRVVMVLSLV